MKTITAQELIDISKEDLEKLEDERKQKIRKGERNDENLSLNLKPNWKEDKRNKMNISNFTKQQGEFLKAEHVGKEATVKIIGEAEIVHNEKYDTDRLHIPVKLSEKEYTFDCSKTNARTIQEKLGEDTKDWVGKEIVLEIYKTKTSEGKMTDAINVKN